MLSSGCGFSALHLGCVLGPHGVPWQLQALLCGVRMMATAPSSTPYCQAWWERGRAFSKSFKQNAWDWLWLVWLAHWGGGGGDGEVWVVCSTSGAERDWNTRAELVKSPGLSHVEARKKCPWEGQRDAGWLKSNCALQWWGLCLHPAVCVQSVFVWIRYLIHLLKPKTGTVSFPCYQVSVKYYSSSGRVFETHYSFSTSTFFL